MARQLPELDEMLGNYASENDLMLIRDTSSKQDKRITLRELGIALGGGSALVDMIYPVGSYYETSDADFDPNEAWGGTWEKDTSGRVLVAQDSGTFATIGATGGEEAHKLVASETPKHNHGNKSLVGTWANWGEGSKAVSSTNNGYKVTGIVSAVGDNNQYGWGTDTGRDQDNTSLKIDASHTHSDFGGNGTHNNLQPYKVVARWHRTA